MTIIQIGPIVTSYLARCRRRRFFAHPATSKRAKSPPLSRGKNKQNNKAILQCALWTRRIGSVRTAFFEHFIHTLRALLTHLASSFQRDHALLFLFLYKSPGSTYVESRQQRRKLSRGFRSAFLPLNEPASYMSECVSIP